MNRRGFIIAAFGMHVLAAARARDEPASPNPPFLPSNHGFRFRNAFIGTPLPPALRGLGIERQMRVPSRYGLCGGMSLAAADYFLADAAIPDAVSVPEEGTPLYGYIYRRQTDSLGPLAIMATKFVRWMQLPDSAAEGDSTASLTAKELPAVLSRLGKGELVPLGLVYAKSGGRSNDKAWENHQVLAYRASPAAEGTGYDFFIYDPNYPGHDGVVIRVRPLPNDGDGVACTLRTGPGRERTVRGLFPMPYTRAVPPPV